MKATKFIVLGGGILGILAFFLPMVSVQRADFSGTVSAFQIMKGLDEAAGVDGLKGITMAFFGPAILLALIGAMGVARKKFGRVAGAFSLIFGLIGLGIGSLLTSAAEGDSGIGLTLLLVTGAAGAVGGVLALIKPERGEVAAQSPRLVAAAA
ncbi:MAG: hypothetical protein H0T42_15560 [Deltaproteobacteria bacterium]|nr:hypothetical protein [Deltaproteobacteria bacterium]